MSDKNVFFLNNQGNFLNRDRVTFDPSQIDIYVGMVRSIRNPIAVNRAFVIVHQSPPIAKTDDQRT